MSFIACSSYDSCFNQPLELLVFRKVEGWEKKQGLCPFLKDRGHMFCSFQFCHLKKLLYIFKSHLLYNSGNRGCVGGGGLKNTELSVLFNPHSQVYSGTPLSNPPFSHLHPQSFTSCSLQVHSCLPCPEYRSTVPCSKTWSPDKLWNSDYFRF